MAAKNITVIFRGKSGRTYIKNAYVSDVVDAAVTFDNGSGKAGAGSDPFWFAPEQVTLVDIATVAGTTVMGYLQLAVNGVPSGDTLDYASQLNSLANRPPITITIAAGAKISFLQKAV